MFTASGYSRVSVAEILAEGGLKAPSLYHHFGDKEGIYSTWLQVSLKRLGAELSALVGEELPLPETLVRLHRALTAEDSPDVLAVWRDCEDLSPHGREEALRLLEEQVYRPVEAALGQGQRREAGLAKLIVNAMASSRNNYFGEQPSRPAIEAWLAALSQVPGGSQPLSSPNGTAGEARSLGVH
ncbi:MAG: TetR/AcrR family transcriptional regulator [Fimbriimonadaceae bacterium]|nr:TetR/AcrR family transcriptional regulator [Fimbriimonadaceae bacterium]QYK55928.1 MAG: TetR/AcrR family transcriptional regulator [Fimbriimonadaceae bacterium]